MQNPDSSLTRGKSRAPRAPATITTPLSLPGGSPGSPSPARAQDPRTAQPGALRPCPSRARQRGSPPCPRPPCPAVGPAGAGPHPCPGRSSTVPIPTDGPEAAPVEGGPCPPRPSQGQPCSVTVFLRRSG